MGQWWWGGGVVTKLFLLKAGPPSPPSLILGGWNELHGRARRSFACVFSPHPTLKLRRTGHLRLLWGGVGSLPRFFSTHPVTSTRAQVASLTEGRKEREKERRKGFSPILPPLPSMKYPASPSGAQWEAVCSWDLLIDLLTMSTQPTVSVHTAQDILIVYSYVTKRALQHSGRPVGTS